MKTEDFPAGTIGDLANGSTVENGHRKVIIGENNTVAFTDDWGQWQVATGVVWDAVEDSARLTLLLKRKKINDIISREWPEGTLDEFYSESSDHAMVIDKDGTVWQVYPDGGIKSYR